MVDKTVLGRIVLGLQSTEKCLLGTEDLDGTGRVLRQAQQAAGVADQPRADKLADECGQVGCDGVHAVPQVLGELCAVRGDGNDLVTEGVYVGDIGVGDFCAHGDFCGSLYCRFEVLREDGGEVGRHSVCAEAWQKCQNKRVVRLKEEAHPSL